MEHNSETFLSSFTDTGLFVIDAYWLSEIEKCSQFPLGEVITTEGALTDCPTYHLEKCLRRHASGDWGCVGAEDAAVNDRALASGARLLSAYPIDPRKPCKGWGDNTIWIITERL